MPDRPRRSGAAGAEGKGRTISTTQTTTPAARRVAEASPWQRDGLTVYALNERGVNRFYARVQDAFTSDAELEPVARLMEAAPDLRDALAGFIAMAVMQGANVPDDLVLWALGQEIGEPVERTRAAIRKMGGGE